MVGHVKPRKGVLQAVEAMAMVVQRFPDAVLYIAGSLSNDSYIRQIKERITALGIRKMSSGWARYRLINWMSIINACAAWSCRQ